MQNFKTMLTGIFAALAIVVFPYTASAGENATTEVREPIQKSDQCASDSVYFTILDWEKTDEASDMLAWAIRTRLQQMMISPGWEDIRSVVVASADRPFLTREYSAGPYNAKVLYRYCWEYKGQ